MKPERIFGVVVTTPDKVEGLRTEDSAKRKEYPIFSGLLAYFPDALAEVAHISYLGNQKHNPGQPLHHARGKSNDHLDCAARHLIQAQWDEGDENHLAEAAWRVLAELQVRCERKRNLSPPAGTTTDQCGSNMTPEGRVKAKVKRILKEYTPNPYSFWPVQTGMGASTLDCLICIKGKFVAIETKAKGKWLTERQKIVAGQITTAGGIVIVVTPETDFEWLVQYLEKLCRT